MSRHRLRLIVDRRSSLFWSATILGSVLLAACGLWLLFRESPQSGPQKYVDIYWPATDAYDVKVGQFAVSPAAARESVDSIAASGGPVPAGGGPELIIGDCYLFAYPDKPDQPLNGYYVDGATGEVIYRPVPYRVPRGQSRFRDFLSE